VGAAFDVSKYVKFVPDFWETEVNKYFLHSEKVASNLKWPEDHCALLPQSSLVGKAREVYSALSVEESSQYSLVQSRHTSWYQRPTGRNFEMQRKTLIKHMQNFPGRKKHFVTVLHVQRN